MSKADDLMRQWDKMDSAAQRVLTALPTQMTAAAETLERERLAMRAALMAFLNEEARRQVAAE